MRGLWVGATLLLATAGCGQHAAARPAGGASPAAVSAPAAAGPPWYAVVAGGPRIPGAVRQTAGPGSADNGFDDDTQFQRGWSYTGRIVAATVEIDRADPRHDQREAMRGFESMTRGFGHVVVVLPAIGDGGLAILSREQKGDNHPLVRAEACSGNATVSVLMYLDGAITTEADLTAHASELTAALSDVLDDLRPR